MCKISLTTEQSIFAAEHHGLVFDYLKNNHLSEDEYYDIVIFGYLRAVRRYFNEENLRKYKFATIAWAAMRSDLLEYYRANRRQKRNADTISLHVGISRGGLPLEEILSSPDGLMQRLETELLLHDLASRISNQQMNMVRQKSSGYGIRDIALNHNTTMRRVKELLEEVRAILLEMCHE